MFYRVFRKFLLTNVETKFDVYIKYIFLNIYAFKVNETHIIYFANELLALALEAKLRARYHPRIYINPSSINNPLLN